MGPAKSRARIACAALVGACVLYLGGQRGHSGSAFPPAGQEANRQFLLLRHFHEHRRCGRSCLPVVSGRNSIALVALYRLVEEIYYFSVSFPLARWYGEKKSGSLPGFRDFRFDPILAVIVCALLLGISLNIAGVPRPEKFGFCASSTMLVATVFFLFAIGLTLRPSSVASYWPQSLVMCGIKFAGIPIVVTALAKGIGYGGIEGGLPLKVVCILSAMPVAMTALVPPSLFNLDVDLANACWIFTTLGLVLILPVLLFILPVL